MARLKGSRKEDERCDHCAKWVEVITDLCAPLEGYEQFAICDKCFPKYDEEYWRNWCANKK